VFKESTMAKTRPPYTPEFRRQMVELVRAGRSPEELAQEFEPTAQSIRNWVGQAECDAGRGGNGLTTAERGELNQLRRENRQLRLEREPRPPVRIRLERPALGDFYYQAFNGSVSLPVAWPQSWMPE
jgi:transposase